jgi:hypothetical protein
LTTDPTKAHNNKQTNKQTNKQSNPITGLTSSS